MRVNLLLGLALLLTCCGGESSFRHPVVPNTAEPLTRAVDPRPVLVQHPTEVRKPEEKPLPPEDARDKIKADLEWANSYLHTARERSK